MNPVSSKEQLRENYTLFLKNQFQKIFAFSSQFVVCCSLLLLLSSSALYAQSVTITDEPKHNPALLDSIEITATGLPLFKPLNSDSLVTPHYEHLWIFGDGNFLNGTKDSTVRHRFNIAKPGKDTFEVQTFLSGLYGGGGVPPPRMIDGGIEVENLLYLNPKPIQATEGVNSGFIRLQKNHLQLVPGDTTAWILSFKNTIAQSAPFSGQVLMFFDSPIKNINYNPFAEHSKTHSVVSNKEDVPIGRFQFDTTLFFFDGVVPQTYYLDTIKTAQLSQYYQQALIWQFDSLQAGEERHLFIQFSDDPELLNKVAKGKQGSIDFLAVMTSSSDSLDYQRPDSFTPDLFEVYGIQEFLDSIDLHKDGVPLADSISSAATDFDEFKFEIGRLLLDADEVSSSIAATHTPNQLSVDACVCPVDSDGANQLLCTIDFVNNGNTRTNDLFVFMHIPTDLDFNSIPDTLFRLSRAADPKSNTRIILEKNLFKRTIKWSLFNFPLEAAQVKGVGHPSTSGQLVFSILSRPGIELNQLTPLRACIGFVDNPTLASCTFPAKAQPISKDPALTDSNDFLACNACAVPNNNTPINSMFWAILAGIFAFIVSIFRGRKKVLNNKTQRMVPSSQ